MSVSGKQPFTFDLAARVEPRPGPAPVEPTPVSKASGDSAAVRAESPVGYRRVCMRLPCDLYGQVKTLAANDGTTVTDVVASALRMRLARPDLFETVGESMRP